ncbi:hypothetical protein BH23VER1_BH23VER1_03320 [soil metagenome]
MITLIETVGWTLLHFLWQGALVAAALWAALRVLHSAPATWRYGVASGALLLMLGWAGITGIRQWQVATLRIASPPSPEAAAAVPAPPGESSWTAAAPAMNPQGRATSEGGSRPAVADGTPATTGPAPPSRPDVGQALRPWLPWVVSFWACGVAVFSVGFLRSWLALRRLRSGAAAPGDPAAVAIFARLLVKMRPRVAVELLATAEAVVPMVVGWLRPAIIVPASLFTRLPAWQVEAILAHELAHVRRHDFLVNVVQNVVETIFFYHPAVWWVSSQLRMEREHCCDDAAAPICGGALGYAKALTALEEMRGVSPAGAVSASGGSLLERVRRLLGVPTRQADAAFSWPAGLAVALLVAGLLAGTHLVEGNPNREPQLGRALTQAELDDLAFGPAGANGLRAAWSLHPRKPTYVFGDRPAGYLTLWNTGDETLVIGNGTDHPGLRPRLDLQARSQDGREIGVTIPATTGSGTGVNFIAKWRLGPGEAAVIGGYTLRVGEGETREASAPTRYSTDLEIRDLRSGDEVELTAALPYPRTPGDGAAYENLQTGTLRFNAVAATDMTIWTATGAGSWPMAGGATLEVRQEVYHGSDVLTTAILHWPDGKKARIQVALDAFANREPWAMAWESGEPILWIATGELRPMQNHTPARIHVAARLRRVDFGDSERIEETYLTGWPDENAPSPGCIAAMGELMQVEAGGEADFRSIHWATRQPFDGMADTMTIHLHLDKDGETFQLGNDERRPLGELVDALRAEAANRNAQWQERLDSMHPDQRAAAGEAAQPHAVVSAPEAVPRTVISMALQACRDAGVGPAATTTTTTTTATTTPAAPEIRGQRLGGVPQADDVTTIADLYEPDPDNPGRFRKKAGVFVMNLGVVNAGPWLYRAANSAEFYLQIRPDPDIVKDVIYGPIAGDPVEKLDLTGWLRDSPTSGDPGYARRVARDMIACGDESLARLALAWLGEFEIPSPPDEHSSLIAAVEHHLEANPDAATAGEARDVLAALEEMEAMARERWEELRETLPEDRYSPGGPIGAEAPPIVWGDPAENGLRLGVAGVSAGAEWVVGSTIAFDVFVRNDGDEPVKFAWTPRIDDGLSAILVGADGQHWRASIVIYDTLLIHSRCRLDPGHYLKLKSGAAFEIVQANEDGPDPGAGKGTNRFLVDHPGRCQLQIQCALGIRDWTDRDGKEFPHPAREWAGTLEAKPVEVTLVAGTTAAAGQADPRHQQSSAVLKLWREEFGDAAQIPAEATQRLADKVAEFIERYPGPEAEGLKALLPDLESDRALSWEAAQETLDAIGDIATAPVGWLELDETFRSFERVKPGEAWPEDKLAALPFGPAADNGLRAAWIFDPMNETYAVGDVLESRIIFHNSGAAPVEFVTDQWHQDDTWHVTDAEGNEIPTRKTWFTGITPYQRYELAPGQTCEVAGHGVGIGVAEFAEATSQAKMGMQIFAAPGGEVRCRWEVSLRAAWKQPDGTETEPAALTTGEVRFRVVPAPPAGERPPGIAQSTGRFDLAPGVTLHISQIGSAQGYDNRAWIRWDAESGAADDGKFDIALPRNADPKDYSVPTFVWPRGGSNLWIVQGDALRKLDFSTVGRADESAWIWARTPEDFGGAPEDVRRAIEKHAPD